MRILKQIFVVNSWDPDSQWLKMLDRIKLFYLRTKSTVLLCTLPALSNFLFYNLFRPGLLMSL